MENRGDALVKIRTVFEQYYQEFEASGYDTLLIAGFLPRMDEEGVFNGVSENPYYDWRCLFEYFLRRLPKEEIITRELLLMRVNDLWAKQREEEYRRDIVKKSENTWKNLIRSLMYDLSLMLQKFGFEKTRKALPENAYENRTKSTEEYSEEPSKDKVQISQENGIITDKLLKTDIARMIPAFRNASNSLSEKSFVEAFGLQFEEIRTLQYKEAPKHNERLYQLFKNLCELLSQEDKRKLAQEIRL